MEREQFDSILDFAIEREENSVAFYHDLLENTQFITMKELLRDFELMERGHIEMLQKMKSGDIEPAEIEKVEDLKISDYTITPSSKVPRTYQDLVILGLKREALSHNLYRDLARDFEDPEIKEVFEKLAAEELTHKRKFEELYDNRFYREN